MAIGTRILAAGIGLAATATLAGCGGSTPVVAADRASSSTGASADAARTEVPASRLSEPTLAKLREDGSTVATPNSLEMERAQVQAETAGTEAARRFDFLTAGRKPTEQALLKVTNDQYGDAVDPENLANTKLKLIIEDRLCWVSVFDGVKVTQSGPVTPDGKGGKPKKVYSATLIVISDAQTGQVLRGTTI